MLRRRDLCWGGGRVALGACAPAVMDSGGTGRTGAQGAGGGAAGVLCSVTAPSTGWVPTSADPVLSRKKKIRCLFHGLVGNNFLGLAWVSAILSCSFQLWGWGSVCVLSMRGAGGEGLCSGGGSAFCEGSALLLCALGWDGAGWGRRGDGKERPGQRQLWVWGLLVQWQQQQHSGPPQ